MISSKKNKTYRAPHKGLYKPSNPKKYVGDSRNIQYRSSWEKRFMIYCDKNPDIVSWASEEMFVPYKNPVDNKIHRYFPDFIIKTAKGRKMMIEIKPKAQCMKPKPRSRKTKKFINECLTFATNQAKWKAAKNYCDDNGLEFKIVTEIELGIKPF